jgi:hypothetical protein
MIRSIYSSLVRTQNSITNHLIYPDTNGIYGMFLIESSSLKEFGAGGRLIYIGIAKNSLKDRDFNDHFNTRNSGRSTLRRSIGAILKVDLSLKAIPRGGSTDSLRYENYKFDNEEILTEWMITNLNIGYWAPIEFFTYKQIRDLEMNLTIEYKPTLDLDNRTRKYNPKATELQRLREICKIEAGK